MKSKYTSCTSCSGLSDTAPPDANRRERAEESERFSNPLIPGPAKFIVAGLVVWALSTIEFKPKP